MVSAESFPYCTAGVLWRL